MYCPSPWLVTLKFSIPGCMKARGTVFARCGRSSTQRSRSGSSFKGPSGNLCNLEFWKFLGRRAQVSRQCLSRDFYTTIYSKGLFVWSHRIVSIFLGLFSVQGIVSVEIQSTEHDGFEYFIYNKMDISSGMIDDRKP